MKLLVIGGTQFSGLHLVREAVRRGDQVTIVHRGKHDEGLPDGIERVLGDRDPKSAGESGSADALAMIRDRVAGGERWDAVVDMCGYVPRVVGAWCEVLREATERYLFVSTISVYPPRAEGGPDESGEVIRLEDPSVEEVTGETYGGLKVLCEHEVNRAFGERATVLRPCVIVGPGDMTDRFTYWIRRIDQGGRVLVPGGDVSMVTRWIDARDFAGFMRRCLGGGTGEGIGGTMNVCAPEEPMGFGAFVEGVRQAIDADGVEFVARDESVLAGVDVLPWRDLPMWVGVGGASMMRVRADRAYASGLEVRPLAETARDTLVWDAERGQPELKAGMSTDREAEAIRGLGL